MHDQRKSHLKFGLNSVGDFNDNMERPDWLVKKNTKIQISLMNLMMRFCFTVPWFFDMLNVLLNVLLNALYLASFWDFLWFQLPCSSTGWTISSGTLYFIDSWCKVRIFFMLKWKIYSKASKLHQNCFGAMSSIGVRWHLCKSKNKHPIRRS